MRRIRMIIEYDGTQYVGWQTQPNGLAIQEVIEKELFRITGQRPSLQASGRTDSGVHAAAQVAHFDTACRIPGDKFAYALNAGLPRDIRIRYSEECPGDFHSRFCAKQKHYRYTLQLGPHARVFSRNYSLHIHSQLNWSAMEAAAAAVTGTHDFVAFKSANSQMENTTRTVFYSRWTQEGELCYYDVVGNGFLYNMVRILVGTMLDIGKGILPEQSMALALCTGIRNHAGATAPAHGLCLMGVSYPSFDTDTILKAQSAPGIE